MVGSYVCIFVKPESSYHWPKIWKRLTTNKTQKLLCSWPRGRKHMFIHKVFSRLLAKLSYPWALLFGNDIPTIRIDICNRNIVGVWSEVCTFVHKGSTSTRSWKLSVCVVCMLGVYVVSGWSQLLQFVGAWSWEVC